MLSDDGNLRPKLRIPGLSDDRCLPIARAGTFSRYKDLRADALAGRCPFCDLDRETHEVIAENTWWLAFKVPEGKREANTEHHILIVPTDHHERLADLPNNPMAAMSFFGILFEIERRMGLLDYGLLLRNGAKRLAGTQEHFHWHIMTPNGEGRLETPLAKSDAEEDESTRRAILYERMVQGERFEDFTPEEQALLPPKRMK